MSVYIRTCETDEDVYNYGLFTLCHRRDIHPAFWVEHILYIVNAQIAKGLSIIAHNFSGEVVGISYVLIGTPENRFADTYTVRINAGRSHVRSH